MAQVSQLYSRDPPLLDLDRNFRQKLNKETWAQRTDKVKPQNFLLNMGVGQVNNMEELFTRHPRQWEQ